MDTHSFVRYERDGNGMFPLDLTDKIFSPMGMFRACRGKIAGDLKSEYWEQLAHDVGNQYRIGGCSHVILMYESGEIRGGAIIRKGKRLHQGRVVYGDTRAWYLELICALHSGSTLLAEYEKYASEENIILSTLCALPPVLTFYTNKGYVFGFDGMSVNPKLDIQAKEIVKQKLFFDTTDEMFGHRNPMQSLLKQATSAGLASSDRAKTVRNAVYNGVYLSKLIPKLNRPVKRFKRLKRRRLQ